MMPRRFPWFTIGMLFLATALSFLDRQVLSTLAPRLMAEFGLSNTEYSRILFLFQLSYTAMSALGGYLIDRYGVKRGLGITLALWSVASAAHAFARSAVGLGAARFALGIGEGACFPAATRGVVDYVEPQHRSFATGVAIGGSALGAVVAPPLTLQLVSRVGWRAAFLSTGLLGMTWCIFWFVGVPRAERREEICPPTPLRQVLTHPALPWFLLARFLFDPVFYFYMFWIPQFLVQTRGLSLQAIGNLYWIPFLCLGISQIFSGKVTDWLAVRQGRPVQVKRMMLLLAACLTPVSWLAGTVVNVSWAVACMSLLLFVHGVWITNYLSLAAELFPERHNASVVGLTGTVGGVAGMLSTLLIGPIVDRWSFLPIFVVSGLLYPLAYLMVRVALHRQVQDTIEPLIFGHVRGT